VTVQRDIQQAVEQLLSIEREAGDIVRRGEEDARAIRKQAACAAKSIREEMVARARREADEAITCAIAQAELQRDQRLAETAREMDELERSARQRRRAAVLFAVASLLGEPVDDVTGPTPQERQAA
jgi:hypothetical protein